MGDAADDLYDRGMAAHWAHILGECEYGCEYCVEEEAEAEAEREANNERRLKRSRDLRGEQ